MSRPRPELNFEGRVPIDRKHGARDALLRSRESFTGTLRWDADAAGWRVVSAVYWPPEDRSITGRATQRAMPTEDGTEYLKRILKQFGEPVVD